MAERLQKLMSQAGIASRREAETIITQGRVTVNGKRAQLGESADPATDDIRVDGARLRLPDKKIYVMINKPMQVVTTVRAQEQEMRRTVRELVPVEGHLYPVGRLDADSEGLVLLTSDGDLAQRMTHPRYQHAKTYEVTVYGRIEDQQVELWRRGVELEDGKTLPADVLILERTPTHSVLRVVMREGRKRQIRRVAKLLGHPVRSLIRTHLGALSMGALKPGEWRHLTADEVTLIKNEAAKVEKPPASRRSQGRARAEGARDRRQREGGGAQPETEHRERRPQAHRENRDQDQDQSHRERRPSERKPAAEGQRPPRSPRPEGGSGRRPPAGGSRPKRSNRAPRPAKGGINPAGASRPASRPGSRPASRSRKPPRGGRP